jgi:hypothetical protein
VKVKLLDKLHPTLDGAELEQLRALADGGQRWRSLLTTWLPQNAAEPADVYADRQSRAVYHNYAGGILGLLAAYLFSRPPTIDGAKGDYWTAFYKNVDQEGTPWSRWWRLRFRDALVEDQVLTWVNLPARSPGQEYNDLGAELKGGVLDAYLVPILADELRYWSEDKHGRLVWVLFRQCVDERTTVEADVVRVYRWTYIDENVIRRWEWRSTAEQLAPKPEDDATELPTIAHKMGRIPVVRLKLPNELWAMQMLRDPAIAHLRSRNDLTWALHKTAHALMIIKRRQGGDDPTVGPGYYLALEPEDEVGWTEPAGNSTAILREDCADLREEIYRVVNQMALATDNSSSRVKASGESKAFDWQASAIVMSAYADLVKGAMLEVLAVIRGARGEKDEVSIGGLDGWQSLSLDQFLAGSAMALHAAQMSPTFRREVAKREAERLLPDLGEKTMAVIRAEIDESNEEDRMAGALDTGIEKSGTVEVQIAFAEGKMSRQMALASLTGVYAVPLETAEKMLEDGFEAKPDPAKAPPPGPPGAVPRKPAIPG